MKILAFNDFHGHLSDDCLEKKPPVGSAPVLAACLADAAQGMKYQTFIVHAGDQVGASVASSALLNDEPSIRFLNLLANRPGWSIIGTLGNHEFDRGKEEMLRLTRRTSKGGPPLENPYRGAQFPYVCANVICTETDQPLLPPFVIRIVQGVPIAFIGAVTTETPHKVDKSTIAGLRFQDEAEAINYQVDLLKRWGVRTIVVLLHAGGFGQARYDGPTDPRNDKLRGKIVEIVNRLDGEVDVVISGHSHKFTNALVNSKNHKKVLVTQAIWHGEAYADIDLMIDPATRDVVSKRAQIKTADRAAGSAKNPDLQVCELVKQAEARVNQIILPRYIKEVIGQAKRDISKAQNDAGESDLGKLVADAQREAGQTQFAFVNPGGIRADKIAEGDVTWGDLFCVQPFRNKLVIVKLTGQQIYELLTQQWYGRSSPMFLQVSGLCYTWDAGYTPPRILGVKDEKGKPINKASTYTVTVNDFLAKGGDKFSVLEKVKKVEVKEHSKELDALITYIEKYPTVFYIKTAKRIIKVNSSML